MLTTVGCIQLVDWTGGLDYWTDWFDIKNTLGDSSIYLKVVSMA